MGQTYPTRSLARHLAACDLRCRLRLETGRASGSMGLRFEWHDRKASSNLEKHGVSFREAATAFGDPFSLTISDPDHSEGEIRFVLIGLTTLGRLVTVVSSERRDTIRLISARRATPRERRSYES